MVKSLVLLSGGLDSLVCTGLKHKELNINLALTFDYGQKSLKKELSATKWFADFYGLKHEVIKLDWLKNITTTALVANTDVPNGMNTVKSVWVPNRNGLFLNIAASYADAQNYTHIIIGANAEEAASFPDNTKEFIEKVNNELFDNMYKLY